MLSYFKIKNFKSIVEEEISFEFNQRKPNGYNSDYEEQLFLQEGGDRFVPISAFWGANASGKTNIIKALNVFEKIFQDGMYSIDGSTEYFYPNKLHEELNSTYFEIGVKINKKLYTYLFEYNTKIVKEIFLINKKVIFSIDNNKSNFNNISKENTLFDNKNLKNFFEKSCLRDSEQIFLFLTKIITNYPSFNNDINNFFQFISKQLRIFSINNFPSSLAINLLSEKNDPDNLQCAFDKIATILQKLDISISKITFRRDTKKLDNYLSIIKNEYNNFDCIELNTKTQMLELDTITTYHKNINNKDIAFKFREDESEGTKILFGLIGIILKALDDGAVLVIDELERSLHPLILIAIIKMFKSKYWNKNNAQLIFTTHNTDILDDNILKITEINIVKKTLKYGTKVARLNEYKNENGEKIRNVINFRKQYLAGLYSGIPFTTI